MMIYLRYILLSILSIIFILVLKNSFDNSLKKAKDEFLKSELIAIESLSSNIAKNIKNEILDDKLFDSLKWDVEMRRILENNLEIIINKKYKYTYVVHKDENSHFRILLDGSLEDKSEFNEPVGVVNDAWEEIYKTKKPIYFQEDSITDSIWMTYLYPIIIKGEIQGVLAIDFDIKEIDKSLEYFNPLQKLLTYILYLFVAIIIFILFLVLLSYKKNTKVIEQEKTIEENETFYKALLDSQVNIVLTFDKDEILNANQKFFDFFKVATLSKFKEKYKTVESCFEVNSSEEYLNKNETAWYKYVASYSEDKHKVKIFNTIFSVTGKAIERQGRFIYVVVFSDITYLEEAKIKANEANEAKGKFLANMSHEIRTPMNAIIGLTNLIIETRLNKKQEDYLQKIKSSTNSLLRIINDILDYSKIEAGKMTLEKRSFKFFDLIDKIRQMFYTHSSSYNDIKFEIHIDPNVPRAFIGDIVRLEQIIINLLSNSFKFTKEGSVELLVKAIKDNKYNLCFEIKDTGIGIENEKIDTLFESFTQEDSSTTRNYGGTGLGLSITKQLVTLFGGEIEVNSEKGIGSSFKVYLNLEIDEDYIEDVKNIQDDMRKELLCYHKVKILVAEDNLINQDVIQGYLGNFDFEIDLTNDGQECLEKFKTNFYDLVLMDINMPNMNGYEATKEIRKIETKIPIIALSANARDEDISYSLSQKMNAHIVKPIEFKALYKTLCEFLPKSKKGVYKPQKEELDLSTVAKLDSIDTQRAIENLHSKELYLKILKRFYDEYVDILPKIDDLVEKNDLKELLSIFHNLKSASGNIEAKNLYEKVNGIYKSLQNNRFDKEYIQDITDLLPIVIEDINNYLKSEKEETIEIEKKEFSEDVKVSKAFERLKIHLEEAEIKMIKKSLKDIEKLVLKDEVFVLFKKVEKAINMYDFAKALDNLNNLKEIK